MSISSIDTLRTNINSGKNKTTHFNKTSTAGAYITGTWMSLFQMVGQPSAGAFSGTALRAQPLTDYSAGALTAGMIDHGGNVSPSTKHLYNMEFTGLWQPNLILLVDMLAYFPGIDTNSLSAQTLLTNGGGAMGTTNILPNRQGVQHDGQNVYMYLEQIAACGATPFNISVTYTNTTPTEGKTLGATVAGKVSSLISSVTNSGVGAANSYCGPFLPLATGDAGVTNAQSIQFSAQSGTASTAALVLCEPLAIITNPITALWTKKDQIFSTARLPRIRDGACLSLLLYCGANSSSITFMGNMDFVWS